MESRPSDETSTARSALSDVRSVRRRVGDRVDAPWWYHVGLGLCATLLLASIDLPREWVSVAVASSGILLPAVLIWLVKRVTGVGLDRYRIPAGERAMYGLYVVLLVLLLGIGMAAKLGLGVPWAMLGAGLVVFVPSVWVSYRIDRGYQRELSG